MKKQTRSNYKTIVFNTIAILVFVFAASSLAAAQKGVGAKYGARDPQACAEKPAAGNKPTAAEAVAAVICNSEHEFGGALYLVEDVKVTAFGKGQRPNPFDRLYPSKPDLDALEYEIRGSFKKYQCVKVYTNETQRNCELYEQPNAKGVCYKNTFGSWVCTLSDQSVTEHRSVVPPGGKKPNANATAPENETQTTDQKGATDENGFVKPDFSELEKYFEIIRWEYDFSTPRFYITVKVKKQSYLCREWFINFYDADGVRVKDENNFIGDPSCSAANGETTRIYAFKPTEKEMKEVKKVSITRRPI